MKASKDKRDTKEDLKMGISTVQIVLLVIFGCIAGMGSVLDSFQTHRPLIACTVVGLILGDVKTGILLGGTLEMIALGWMNIGAAQSPDSALASIISTILVVVGHQSVANGIAIALPVAVAGQVLTVFARTVTIFFQHAADKYAEDANFKMLDICHVAAVVSPEGLQTLLNSIPKVVTGGLTVAGGMIVVVGYAMVLNMMGAKYLMPFFFLGFVIAAFTEFNLVAFGIMGAVFAIVYVQLNPKFQTPVAAPVTAGAGGSDDLDDDLDDELD